MILRPRQKAFVERCVAALLKHGNTLGVAPTGAGKTIMLSGVVGDLLKNGTSKACVLAHRDELTDQNNQKFLRVNPDVRTSIFDAKGKSWDGDVTFAMVQTLSREASLDQARAQRMSDRAVKILNACDHHEMLPRVANTPTYYICKFCPWQDRCWRDGTGSGRPSLSEGAAK